MRLNQVTVPTLDLTASVDFYRRLGLTLIVLAEPRYARFETPGGETFSVHLVEGTLPDPSVRTMVYFEVDDVDATAARLIEAGLTLDQPAQDQTWLWREARLSDPDGNPVCIFHAGENRRFPPWRLPDA